MFRYLLSVPCLLFFFSNLVPVLRTEIESASKLPLPFIDSISTLANIFLLICLSCSYAAGVPTVVPTVIEASGGGDDAPDDLPDTPENKFLHQYLRQEDATLVQFKFDIQNGDTTIKHNTVSDLNAYI